MKKPKIISILKYPEHKMAFIQIDGKTVYLGNYDDFYLGCHGNKVAGFDLTCLWDKGIQSLANCLKNCIKKTGSDCEIQLKKLNIEEYKNLMTRK